MRITLFAKAYFKFLNELCIYLYDKDLLIISLTCDVGAHDIPIKNIDLFAYQGDVGDIPSFDSYLAFQFFDEINSVETSAEISCFLTVFEAPIIHKNLKAIIENLHSVNEKLAMRLFPKWMLRLISGD